MDPYKDYKKKKPQSLQELSSSWDKRRKARVILRKALPQISHVGVADNEGMRFSRLQRLAGLSSKEMRTLLTDMIIDGTVIAFPVKKRVVYYRRKERT